MEKKPGKGKSLIDLEPSADVPLMRTLSLTQTTFIDIGTAMGGVMFAIIGRAIAVTSPSILVKFIIGAFFALLIGLSYAALGAAVPGGAGLDLFFITQRMKGEAA